MDLYKQIIELIESKREGKYWDFKLIPYSNESDLLHDIICMSNSTVNSDRYIILGISDPASGCIVKGLNAIKPRKVQSDYIDFIRAQPFAAENRPEIEVRTIVIGDKEVDIIVIMNTKNMPYYLSKDKFGLKANHIYTRSGDTNTPKNKTADYHDSEKIWRNRFGLDEIPSERFKTIVKNRDDWDINIGNRSTAYYINSPEYQIEFGEVREGWEPYSYYYPNEKSYFGVAYFKYLSTTLFEKSYAYIDEMRIAISTPGIELIKIESDDVFYYYYEKNSFNYDFLSILGLRSLLMSLKIEYQPFIFFSSEIERHEYNTYVSSLNVKKSEIVDRFSRTHITEKMKRNGINSEVPIYMDFFVSEYHRWKRIKKEF